MTDYPRMVAETVSELPVNKQAEVYHFAKYIKNKTRDKKTGKRPKGTSVFDLFGTAQSKVTDAAANHDAYLHE